MTSTADALTRRALIRRGASSVAAATLVGSILQACSGGDSDSTLDNAPETSSPITTTTTTPTQTAIDVGPIDPAVLAVGTAYLKAFPDEADVATLVAALGDPAPAGALEAAQVLIEGDFANQRTVVLDGWVLASSEAQAAALLALVCESSC